MSRRRAGSYRLHNQQLLRKLTVNTPSFSYFQISHPVTNRKFGKTIFNRKEMAYKYGYLCYSTSGKRMWDCNRSVALCMQHSDFFRLKPCIRKSFSRQNFGCNKLACVVVNEKPRKRSKLAQKWHWINRTDVNALIVRNLSEPFISYVDRNKDQFSGERIRAMYTMGTAVGISRKCALVRLACDSTLFLVFSGRDIHVHYNFKHESSQ